MKKMLNKDLKDYRKYLKNYNPAQIDEVMDYYHMKTSIRDLECLLETLNEIEGIEHHNIILNSCEFEEWKKEITL